jgi:23S rRNA (uracil1939-C5)-methyltransferase
MVQLRIDSLAFGGEACGRDENGRVVFVSGGAPGDLVEVRIVDEKRRFARAELLRVVEPGAARIVPACAIADRCGGCPWMHVSREAQLAAKEAIVRRALARLDVEVRQIVSPTPPLGYRVRARWSRKGDAVGYSARRSHDIVDVTHCPALVPELEAAMLAHKSRVREGGSLVGLAAPDGRVSVGVPGQSVAELDVGFFADAHAFTQASWAGNEQLRALVRDAVGDSRRILELYAGAGNFTRDFVDREGIAVEGEAAAAARLARLLPPAWRALPLPVGRALQQIDGRFDVVVLDPPRAGAAEVMPHIARLTSRMVYVSCDPMTLARDLAAVGWRGWAQPVEMMPQTSHVEVVAYMQSTREK